MRTCEVGAAAGRILSCTQSWARGGARVRCGTLGPVLVRASEAAREHVTYGTQGRSGADGAEPALDLAVNPPLHCSQYANSNTAPQRLNVALWVLKWLASLCDVIMAHFLEHLYIFVTNGSIQFNIYWVNYYMCASVSKTSKMYSTIMSVSNSVLCVGRTQPSGEPGWC